MVVVVVVVVVVVAIVVHSSGPELRGPKLGSFRGPSSSSSSSSRGSSSSSSGSGSSNCCWTQFWAQASGPERRKLPGPEQ